MRTKERLSQNFYREHYKKESVHLEKVKQVDYLLSCLEDSCFNSEDKVLDVGCGMGILGEEIKKRFGSDVYGIDISEVGIRYAKRTGVKARLADIEEKWPFPNDFFNKVISVQVIEHLLNPDHFFQEARRVTKKGGTVIITTPNLASWFNRIIFLFGYQPFFLEASTIDKTVGQGFMRGLVRQKEPLGHIRCFTLESLKDILKLHGFKPISFQGGRVGYLPNFVNLFDYLFRFFPSVATDLIVTARKI